MQTLSFEPRRRGRVMLMAALLLAHLGLGLLLVQRMRQPVAAAPERAPVWLIASVTPRPVPAAQKRPSRAPTLTRPQPTAVVEAIRPQPALAPPDPPALVLEPTAISPPVREPLLGTDATRRAIRQAARDPLLSERAASAMGDGAPIGPEAKLGRQIQQAGNGECLKGEFAGGGMGLLSLPFWLLAEARGKCSK